MEVVGWVYIENYTGKLDIVMGGRGLIDTLRLLVIRMNCRKYQTLQCRQCSVCIQYWRWQRCCQNTYPFNLRVLYFSDFWIFEFQIEPYNIVKAGLFANAHFLSLYIQFTHMCVCVCVCAARNCFWDNTKLYYSPYGRAISESRPIVIQFRPSWCELLTHCEGSLSVSRNDTTDAEDMGFFGTNEM